MINLSDVFASAVPFLNDGLLTSQDSRLWNEFFSDLIKPKQPTCTHCNRINRQTNLATQPPRIEHTRKPIELKWDKKKKSHAKCRTSHKSPAYVFPRRPPLCWVTMGSPRALSSQRQQQQADVLTHAQRWSMQSRRAAWLWESSARRRSPNTSLTFERCLVAQRFGQSGVIKSSIRQQEFLTGAGLFL